MAKITEGPPPNQGTFKDPDGSPKPKDNQSPEQVIDSLQKRIEQLLQMLDRAHAIINNSGAKMEEIGVDMLVLSRNARGLINQPIQPAEEVKSK